MLPSSPFESSNVIATTGSPVAPVIFSPLIMLYMLITRPSSNMQLMSSLARDLCKEIMLSVASSPSIVELPNIIPSIIRSRRITTPASVDFLQDFLKLSAMPSTLNPFFSEWILRAAGNLLYQPFARYPCPLAVRLQQHKRLPVSIDDR